MNADTDSRLTPAQMQALAALEALVAGARPLSDLSAADVPWLARLGALTGGGSNLLITNDEQGFDLFDPLTLKEHPAAGVMLSRFLLNLKAMLAAHEVGWEEVATMGQAGVPKVVIHNREVAELLQVNYDGEGFAALFDKCSQNGVFAIKINDENGLVTTAEVEENWDMAGRQWVTDTVHCGDIERDLNPQAWTRALLTLCDFYNQPEEAEAIRASIADPQWYRQGGLLNGVAHIFIPHTLKRDSSWFNNKRLESHGLALKAICDTILAAEREPWGFTSEQLNAHGAKIASTVASLAGYLKAINTNDSGHYDFGAPSAGPWEEIPFPAGQTWDTEAIRSGFESLRNLLTRALSSTANVNQANNVCALIKAHEYSGWLQDNKTIDHMIKLARGKVIDRLFGQALPMENPQRPLDCSLAFISTSTIALGDDVLSDVVMQYQLLRVLGEKLVRSHGIIRYAPFGLQMEGGHVEPVFDSYLADNYWLMPELRAAIAGSGAELKNYGSGDCSTEEDYLARVKLARPHTEAEWCFVSVIAEGYARQVLKLKELLSEQARLSGKAAVLPDNHVMEIEELIAYGIEKAGEFISRSYARVTAPGAVKANGHACPAWAIPEAYEYVSPLGPECKTHLGALPGANTPLAWGQSSLYSASKHFKQCLAQNM